MEPQSESNTSISDDAEFKSRPVRPTINTSSRKRQSQKSHAAYPRKRAVQACRTCRLRRTKCDNENPACTSCVNMGIECIYQEKDPSKFDLASLAILQRFDALEQLIRSSFDSSQQLNQGNKTLSSLSVPTDLESPFLERVEDSVSCYINIEAVLSWPIFEGQDFDRRLDLKGLLQDNHEYGDSCSMSVTPDFEECEASHLLQQFLDNVHIFNPVADEAKIKDYARTARTKGICWDAESCLLLLIYALGSIATPYEKATCEASLNFRQSREFKQAESFFFAAQKRMGMLLCKGGVVEAQCFFLAGVYLMSTLRPVEAWRMFVQAVACCQSFRNHRPMDVDHEEERQIEQSIYWSCFKSELELRLELNISEKSVSDLTYPAFFPSPPKGLKSQGEAVWYFYLAEIALRRLGNRILNYVYRYKSSAASDLDIKQAIHNFEDQAERWRLSLPPVLRLDAADDRTTDHAALKFILSGHLLDCYEMMYWPFVIEAVHGSLGEAGIESFSRKGLLVCIDRIQKNESGFYHRHHGTWLMLRSCTRSALVLLAAARSPHLSSRLPVEWEMAIYKVIGMLDYWKEESRDVLDRLDILEVLMRGVTLASHEC